MKHSVSEPSAAARGLMQARNFVRAALVRVYRRASSGKWYRSTWVFAGFLGIVVLLLNLPGQIVYVPDLVADGKYGADFLTIEQQIHGWPLVFLWREVFLHKPPYPRLSLWRPWEEINRFSALALLADAALGALAVLIGGSVFNAWRRRRNRIWQFYLADFFIVVAMIAAMGGVFVFNRAQRREELATLRSIDQAQSTARPASARGTLELGGLTWLRELVGDAPFEVFDRVVVFEADGAELEASVQLSQLKSITIWSTASNRQLKLLERLPNLEALNMKLVFFDDEGRRIVDQAGFEVEQFFRLPNLPRLKGLNLYGTVFRGDGLEHLSNLEVLDLTDTDMNDLACEKLGRLHNLKLLSLAGTKVTNNGLRNFAALDQLEELSFQGCPISDAGLQHLANLCELRRLRLALTEVTDASIPVLKRFEKLQYLGLDQTAITAEGHKQLKAALPSCVISRAN